MSALDAREQLMLELINRARMDPVGEAARYGIDLNKDLPKGTISAAAKQVLAPNSYLESAATGHSADEMTKQYFSHTGSDGSNAGYRMAKAGYAPAGSFGWGENISWSGTTGTLDPNAAVYLQHKNLFLSAGHRENLLNAKYEEAGIGGVIGKFSGYNTLMTTQNFAYDVATDVHVTGVHYTDWINDNFYSVGEGAGGRSALVYQNGSLIGATTTAAAGGYGVELDTTGLIEVVFKNGGLTGERGVFLTLGSENAKVDLVDGNTIETNFTATLSRGSANLKLLGIGNVGGVGNALSNTIVGNAGNNALFGKEGADKLFGGSGNDFLGGGTGDDTLSGGAGADKFCFGGLGVGDDTIVDFTDGVDRLQFGSTYADSVSDLTISGNGTTTVMISHGDDSIMVKGASAIFLSQADFIFI